MHFSPWKNSPNLPPIFTVSYRNIMNLTLPMALLTIQLIAISFLMAFLTFDNSKQ
jgi:hypothetical protein